MPLTLTKTDHFFEPEARTTGHSIQRNWLKLDAQLRWSSADGFILSTTAMEKETEKLGLVSPQGVKRWTAIGTYEGPYWNRVQQGTAFRDVPPLTQFLVWERNEGGYGILLPLLSGDYVNTLEGNANGVRFVATTGRNGRAESDPTVAYTATGHDIHALVEKSIQAISAHSKSFRVRRDKKVPAFVDYLGWCSWDAFYSKVDERKFLSALHSFSKGGAQPGFVILDDGWLDHKGDLLSGLEMNREKFPDGLAELVRQTKEHFGVKFFGIWHALNGYWGGLDPESPLGKRYDLHRSMGRIRPWEGDKQEELYLVDPRQAARFYAEFHAILKAGGVDLIKVDGQSALPEFTRPHFGRVSSMRSYQEALQSSAMGHFDGGMIHCMSNGLDIAYQLEQTLVWRNSDDFFPKKTSSAQQIHVHTNALNNLWTSAFALPDWDMFQSHHRWAEYHAAARALSGGPIYVCDKPGRQNFRLLRQLASSTGRLWRCDRPALPAPESVFADCRREEVLLKIHNRSGAIGLIGFFHCSELRKKLSGKYSPSDVPDLVGGHFIARRHSTGQVEEMNMDDSSAVILPRMGFEIITVSPVLGGWIAALGRQERYTGATSIASASVTPDGGCRVMVKESGSYLFWSRCAALVTDDMGEALASEYDAASRLLTVEMEAAGAILISALG